MFFRKFYSSGELIILIHKHRRFSKKKKMQKNLRNIKKTETRTMSVLVKIMPGFCIVQFV